MNKADKMLAWLFGKKKVPKQVEKKPKNIQSAGTPIAEKATKAADKKQLPQTNSPLTQKQIEELDNDPDVYNFS